MMGFNVNKISDELEGVFFGDVRINRRSEKIIEDLYTNIGNGFTASCGGKAEIKAAYRFFDNNIVDPSKILKPHYEKTLQRIKEHKIVGFMQDTTDIDMKHMKDVEGLGVLNDTTRPGCSLHPVVAFTPEQLCLGTISATFLHRQANELGKKIHNNSREFEDKESFRWLQGYKATCEIAEKCPETLCISIGDRESDIFELMLEATKEENKADLIARAWHNRTIFAEHSEENIKLIEQNEKLISENKLLSKNNKKSHKKGAIGSNDEIIKNNKKIIEDNKTIIKKDEAIVNNFLYQLNKGKTLGTIEFTLPEGRGRKSRLVRQNVKATTVILMPSAHKKHLPKVSINAVLLEEIDAPSGVEPITWMFLTTLPIDTFEQIELIIQLYLGRWGVELFFKVLKSGCGIEELRLESAKRLLSCISIYMIVAWRVLYTTFLGRTCPNLPCSIIFETEEWQSVYAVTMKAKPPEEPPPLGEFMLLIAKLGGFQGRKSQGPPGMIVIWTGLQKAYRLAEGWLAHKDYG